MKRFLYILLLTLLSFFSLSAQIENMNDSVKSKLENKNEIEQTPLQEYNNAFNIETSNKLAQPDNTADNIQLNLPSLFYYKGPALENKETRYPFANDYNSGGSMIINNKSWITGGSMHKTYLGSGQQQLAQINYHQQITDRLIATGGMRVNKNLIEKMGRTPTLYSEAQLMGGLDYFINDRMSLSLSGEYSIYRTGANDGRNPGSLMGNFFPEEPGAFSYGFRPVYWTEMQLNYQVTDWLYISPGIYSSRHEFYQNHFNDFGMSGMMSIRIHERIKWNLYGKKSFRGTDYSIGAKGLHPQDMYGGGIDLKINENFSIESGVIREINPWSGKWETKPYVKPVFHIK